MVEECVFIYRKQMRQDMSLTGNQKLLSHHEHSAPKFYTEVILIQVNLYCSIFLKATGDDADRSRIMQKTKSQWNVFRHANNIYTKS